MGQDLPEEMLTSIFDRIQKNLISLKEDDDIRMRELETLRNGPLLAGTAGLPVALSPASFFSSYYNDMNRALETIIQKEHDHTIVWATSVQKPF